MPRTSEPRLTTPGGRRPSGLVPVYPWLDTDLLLGPPNIGALMALCEENYASLLQLMPDLRVATGSYRASRPRHPDLFLDILDQAPYTTTLRLTYFLPVFDAAVRRPEPDARLRVYHDARQVEVIGLCPRRLPAFDAAAEPHLLDKWWANRFLAKWLSYCTQQGYGLTAADLGAANEDRPAFDDRHETTLAFRFERRHVT